MVGVFNIITMIYVVGYTYQTKSFLKKIINENHTTGEERHSTMRETRKLAHQLLHQEVRATTFVVIALIGSTIVAFAVVGGIYYG